MSKDNYEQKYKRATQELLFEIIYQKNFIGLCGPTPKGYLEVINWKRFKKITLVENNHDTYLKVKDTLSEYPTVTIVYGNISDFLHIKDTFFDFDFCETIGSTKIEVLMDKISRMHGCCLTFCTRKIGNNTTNDKMIAYFPKSNYIRRSYKDGAPMVCYKIL